MMDPNNRHPLETITNRNSLALLEALIPFVEYPFKLPLALLIKFNEIRLIIEAFRSLDYLTRIGLHNPSREPMDILGTLTGISPDMLKMMMNLAENMGDMPSADALSSLTGKTPPDFSALSGILNTFSSPPPAAENKPSAAKPSSFDTSQEEFDRNIQSILAEYDLQQAEALQLKNTEQNDFEPI